MVADVLLRCCIFTDLNEGIGAKAACRFFPLTAACIYELCKGELWNKI